MKALFVLFCYFTHIAFGVKMKKLILILFFALIANAADKFDCSKRYYKEMKSCEEAYHYLRNCGRSGFDRDRDGIPCENICKERRVEK